MLRLGPLITAIRLILHPSSQITDPLFQHVHEITAANACRTLSGRSSQRRSGRHRFGVLWGIAGMFLAVALILIKSPSPMLIAVGMYLPFYSTAAIFVGGIIKWMLEKKMKNDKLNEDQIARSENTGVLIASGLIAGEALMAVVLAFVVHSLNS